MKTLFFGQCDRENLFALSDPDASQEAEFEASVMRALSCLFPTYNCIYFGGGFRLDGNLAIPDLALVSKDFSHWFVIGVELISYSFDLHVLPQIRTFCYGDAEEDCIGHLSRGLAISKARAAELLHDVPRKVVVIANRYDEHWQTSLRALGTELVVVSVFSSPGGVEAFFLEGILEIQKESLGFGVYSAADRSVRFHAVAGLNEGAVKIFDPEGILGSWNITVSGSYSWITKVLGSPSFEDGAYVQLVRSITGELRFRSPSRPTPMR